MSVLRRCHSSTRAQAAFGESKMSMHFRFSPGAFVKHDGTRVVGSQVSEHVERNLKQKCNKPPAAKSSPAALRDSHIVLLAIDLLVALHAAVRKWRNHRRTLSALDELDEHQLRDIGLTREQMSDGHLKYRPMERAD